MTAPYKLLAGFLFYVLLFATEQSFLVTGAFALASDCTKYISAKGSGTACTVGSPCTLDQANSSAVPGDRICFMGAGGKFVRSNGFAPKSGNATGSTWPPSLSSPHAWCPKCIVYEAYGDSPPWITNSQNYNASSYNFLVHGDPMGASITCNVTKPDNFSSNSAQYIIIDGLNFDGQGPDGHNGATTGIIFHYGHHLMVINSYVRNTAGAGIGFINTDYVFVANNKVWHNGEGNTVFTNATSAVTLNGTAYFDLYAGFHNYVINNMMSGDLDDQANTDGNGIIFDLSCNRTPGVANAKTPPGLILNNVIFMNGGNCIINYSVTDIYAINNSCYKNNLNTNLLSSHSGELGGNGSTDDWYINNLVHSWFPGDSGLFSKAGATGHWYQNMWFVGGPDFTLTPLNYNNDPEYVSPPSVSAYPTPGQYVNAPDPAIIGNSFELQTSSSALGKGIDPVSLSGLDPNIVAGLRQYIYKDINGNPRLQGGPFDLGAYAHQLQTPPVPAPPSPPTNLTAVVH